MGDSVELPTIPGPRRVLDRLALPALAGLVIAAWAPSVRAQFGVIDDHQIIGLLDGRARLPLADVVPEIWAHRTEGLGRFRPLYWVGQVVESAVAGDNPHLWYLDRLLLLAITATALWLVARRFVGPWLSVLLVAAALLGPQFEAWTRLGAAETYAMPLFALGLVALVRDVGWPSPARMGVGALALVGAALAKESFWPFAIVVLTVALWRHRRGPIIHLACLGALAVISALSLGTMMHQLAVHGSQYSQVWDLHTISTRAAYVGLITLVFEGGLGLLLIAIVAMRRWSRSTWVILALCGAATAVEIVFYAGADRVGRYLLPTTLAIAAAWIAVWRGSRPVRSSAIQASTVLGIVMLVGSVSLASVDSERIAEANAADTRRFQHELTQVSAIISQEGIRNVVIQPGDPYLDAERVMSWAEYLHQRTAVTVMTTAPEHADDARGRAIARDLERTSAQGTADGLLQPYTPATDCLSLLLAARPAVCSASIALP